MAVLSFQDLKFREKNRKVVVEFLHNYEFEVEPEAFSSIGEYTASGNSIEFPELSEADARSAFNAIINDGLAQLRNITTRKKTLYVHRFSGIPLIGTTSFGIIDRNTNMIEVRPLTGCNMNCIFCSVDEGLASKKTTEVVVEEEYLASEVRKLVEFKACECHIIINSQGEPTLYSPLPQLIRGLKAIPEIRTITLITNGTYLTTGFIDELAAAGLTLMNISLNAIDPKVARLMEGHGKYDVGQVKRMAAYAAKTTIKVAIAPVIVGGYNEAEMDKLVAFAKEIGATTAMQNYLYYRQGRNPENTRQMPWPEFYQKLEELEKKHGSKLIFSASDYGIIKTKPLPKPFRKGQTVTALPFSDGRYPGEFLAHAKGRIITIPRDDDRKAKVVLGKEAKVKIVSDKHNIFYGKVA